MSRIMHRSHTIEEDIRAIGNGTKVLVEDLTEKAGDIRSRAARIAAEFASNVKDHAVDARDTVSDGAVHTAKRVDKFADRAGKQAGSYIAMAGKRLGLAIKEHPFAAVAVVAGLGVVVYKLARR